MRKLACVLLWLASCVVTAAPAPLYVSSNPEGFGNAGNDLVAKVRVEPHADNYQLAVLVQDSEGSYFRSWQDTLREPDGSPTKRVTFHTTLRSLPAGHYVIAATLYRRTPRGDIAVAYRSEDTVCFSGFNVSCAN